MKYNNDIIKLLSKDILKLEKIINNPEKYNFRNKIIRKLIDSGYFFYRTLPFILSMVITSNVCTVIGDKPFQKEITNKSAYAITTKSSLGYTNTDYSITKKDNTFEYSTAWFINSDNMYERIITEYIALVTEDKTAYDYEKILTMTPEEIKELFVVSKVYSIVKPELTEDDYIYNEPVIETTITNLSNSIIKCEESNQDVIADILLYIISTLILGFVYKFILKVYTDKVVTKKIINLKDHYQDITKLEISNMKKALTLKKDNLRILTKGVRNNHYPKVKRRVR